MRIYSIGGFEISPYAKKIKDVSEIDSRGILVCRSSVFDKAICSFAQKGEVLLVLVGCDFSVEALDLLKTLPEDSLLLPLFDRFGSEQFLFGKLKKAGLPANGLLRYVKCGRLSKECCMKKEISFDYSTIVYLLSATMGKVVSKYGKVFKAENLLRFNSILKFENGSILFFEHKFSSYMPESKYWEYAYKGGLIVSDSFREQPLLVVSEGNQSRTIDPFRITGSEQTVADALISGSIKVSDFVADPASAMVGGLLDEFGLKGGAR